MNDYYSLLRVSPQASKLDIINAYRHAKLTFRKDSLAVYSLYNEDELSQIRQEIEEAYNVLSDRDKRMAYNALHGFAPVANDAGVDADEAELRTPIGLQEAGESEAGQVHVRQQDNNVVHLHQRKARDYDPDLERRMQSAEEFPGRFLREVREYRGIDLQEVADHTRISITYLQAIESEDTAVLPAKAYLKGYLGQYAAEIGLEAHRVVHGYPPLTAGQGCSEHP